MSKHTAVYKWESPYEWLVEKSASMREAELRSALLEFARKAGSDEIQDIFESEMDDDGYFDDLSLKFRFVLDINERNRVGFHVNRECDDKTVFEAFDEDARQLIEDGFMDHAEDADGLLEHLKSLKVVPQDATITD